MRQEFTANVSHELKTPLTAISGYSELIQNGMTNEEETIRFAGEIHKSAKRLLTLINDFIRLSELDVTTEDIMEELDKPGRDPRQTIQVFAFDPTVKTIEDLKEGQVLPGIVTNITNFGCFVDVGIKENGLVHISELADRFVSDPTQVVSIHQHVKVKVLSVDLSRKRVQLSMKGI